MDVKMSRFLDGGYFGVGVYARSGWLGAEYEIVANSLGVF